MRKEDFKNLSSWRIDDCVITGKEVYTLDFFDTAPNTFIIQNPNSERILVGITGIPTEDNYEYEIGKNSTKPIGRPIQTQKLYLYNTGLSAIKIKVFSVYKEFDIATLASSSIMIENAEIKTDGMINGFKNGVMLPSGTNKIGSVNVDNFPTEFTTKIGNLETYLQSILEAQESGYPELMNALPDVLNNALAVFFDLLNGVSNINLSDIYARQETVLKEIHKGFSKFKEYSQSEVSGSTSIDFSTEDFIPSHICYIVNDGKNPFTFKIGTNDGTFPSSITINKGEVFSDIPLNMGNDGAIQIVPIVPDGETSSPPISWRLVVSKR